MPKRALIMIDMQRGFLDSASPLCIPSAEATVPACAALIDRCHAAGVPVIYAVRHYRSDGSDVEKPRAAAWAAGGKPLSEDCAAHLSDAFPSAFTVLPQDYVLVKPRFSAFFHTGLDLILRRLGVQTVLLAGTTTPNCIRTTCYDAISLVLRHGCRAGGEPRRYAARGRRRLCKHGAPARGKQRPVKPGEKQDPPLCRITAAQRGICSVSGAALPIGQGAVEMRVMFRPRSPTSTLPSSSEMKGENDTFSPSEAVISTVTSGKISLTLQPITNGLPSGCS